MERLATLPYAVGVDNIYFSAVSPGSVRRNKRNSMVASRAFVVDSSNKKDAAGVEESETRGMGYILAVDETY